MEQASHSVAGTSHLAPRSGFARGPVVTGLAIAALIAASLIAFLYSRWRQETSPGPNEPAPRIPPYESFRGVGRKLPALELEPLTGDAEPVNLKNLAGHVVVVNFWGTWCPPCRQEFPELAELYAEFRKNPEVRLLAVSCGPDGKEDPKELWENTRRFLAGSRREMPTYADPNETTRVAFDRVVGLQAFPTTFVMDRDGIIRGVWPGYHSRVVSEIKDLVQRLLQADGTAGSKSI